MNERRITRGVTQRIHQKHVRRHSLILSWGFPLSISQRVSRCIFLGVLRHSQKVFHEEISEEFFVLFLGGLLINCFSFQSFKDCHFILHFIDIYFVLNSFSNFSRYYLLPANMIGILLIKIRYLRLQSWSK